MRGRHARDVYDDDGRKGQRAFVDRNQILRCPSKHQSLYRNKQCGPRDIAQVRTPLARDDAEDVETAHEHATCKANTANSCDIHAQYLEFRILFNFISMPDVSFPQANGKQRPSVILKSQAPRTRSRALWTRSPRRQHIYIFINRATCDGDFHKHSGSAKSAAQRVRSPHPKT